MNMNAIMGILLAVALLALLAGAASAKSIYFCVVELNKCKTVTLPQSGKCKTITFYGRKIKLCSSSGNTNA